METKNKVDEDLGIAMNSLGAISGASSLGRVTPGRIQSVASDVLGSLPKVTEIDDLEVKDYEDVIDQVDTEDDDNEVAGEIPTEDMVLDGDYEPEYDDVIGDEEEEIILGEVPTEDAVMDGKVPQKRFDALHGKIGEGAKRFGPKSFIKATEISKILDEMVEYYK